ncbi:MAG: 3-methyl-2-oxobutanoate hydroxymethyltransferase [Pseudomonadota bacterium]
MMSERLRSLVALHKKKENGQKIVSLTAYDACSARLLDEAGVDMILVGDSLATVMQGHADTLHATLDAMVYHTTCVSRVVRQAVILADLPFLAYSTPEKALAAAARLMQEGGAHAVKLEGGEPSRLAVVQALADQHVPVCGHLGLQPQSVYQMGAYRVQGRDGESAARLLAQAWELEAAGAQMLVLECVPRELAHDVAQALSIPVVGIGAGPDCDGQVLVLQDMLGMTDARFRFCRNFLADSGGCVRTAIAHYVEAVRECRFPAAEHSFNRDDDVADRQ